MPKQKKTKALTVFSRNSYKGRLKGILPAFRPNRCKDLTGMECALIESIEQDIKTLLTIMTKKK